jgi:lipoprotein-releasing system permease protein
MEVAVIAGMALAFALMASLYPALRASRLDPVEGLRRE